MLDFKFPPFDHQMSEWENHTNDIFRGLFWEQGTGKTKEIIDQAAALYHAGEIDCLFVLAPNGVHRNWICDEVPTHMPESVPHYAMFYESGKSGTKMHKAACDHALTAPGLCVVAMSYDAFMTKKRKDWIGGMLWAKKILDKRRVMFVLDEAHYIKSPSAKRTKTIVAAGKHAVYRRALTGTPVANSPLDVYKIMEFLDKTFWKERGFASYTSFKHYFGIWRKASSGENGREYEYCVGYQNIEELTAKLEPYTSRVTKEDALDLPPKLYQYRYFDMTADQARAYKQIKDEFMLWLESGELITAPLAIVRLLRCHQVTCGYLPTPADENGNVEWHEFERNPRLELLKEITDDLYGKAIIWSRFTRDIDKICALLGQDAVRYDGSTSPDNRAAAKDRFQNGDARWFVANPAAASTGLTLHAATTVIYYNNSFKLTERLQSEDRAHRIGQEHLVNYIDIVAPGTVDEHIVKALRKKNDLATQVLGDEVKAWL